MIGFRTTSKLFFPLLFLFFFKERRLLPALQMLDTPETLEATVHHDGHAGAQGLALLHAEERKRRTFVFLARFTPSIAADRL